MGRAAAMGLTAAAANTMLAGAVRAAGPVRGGTLTLGLRGGESTNRLDPALAASQVPCSILFTIGEPLVEVNPDGSLAMRLAEPVEATPGARTGMFRIRKGITFDDGKTLAPAERSTATWWR
jgi:peptide/nickel transport system substrate-binding protein